MITKFGNKTPNTDSSAFIAPNATVVGDVTIGRKSSVWFGAVVRGDSNSMRIGARTNIQDLCCLHVDGKNPLKIGDDVTVGHRATLHGCTIGNRVLVGMGATIMNGAVIGDDSIVGAGALVTEGTTFPPRSLIIGFPAKLKREITEDEIRMISKSAEHYLETAAIYKT